MKTKGVTKTFSKIKRVSFRSYVPRRIEGIWFLILIFFAILVIATLIWSALLFTELSSGGLGASISVEAEDSKAINRRQLEDLLERLMSRENAFASLTSVEISEKDRAAIRASETEENQDQDSEVEEDEEESEQDDS